MTFSLQGYLLSNQPGQKLLAHNTRIGPLVYADYYHFGDESERVPMVVYCGGAVTSDVYRERSVTSPKAIVSEFLRATNAKATPFVDLLVLPHHPVEEDEAATFRQGVLATLLFDLLPQTLNPRPPALAFVGYSLGASLALYMTLSLAGARGAAIFGGYGTATAGRDSNQVGGVESRKYRAYCNFDDKAYMDMLGFCMFLKSFDLDLDIEMRPGEHSFDDYASNGSLRDAFAFCLELFG